MRIGAHISAAGGVENLPANAHAVDAEVFQFFSRSPQGGSAPTLTEDARTRMRHGLTELGIERYYIHAPYYVNLASPKKALMKSAVRILKEELERGTFLGARGMMFHPGSARGQTRAKALAQVITGVRETLQGYSGSCMLLVENSAGSGEIIGDTFEEIGQIIRAVREGGLRVGVCLDTQHLFASGDDLATPSAVKTTFAAIAKHIGWKHVKVMHANDSLVPCGAHKDRHANIGAGHIGKEGFAAMLAHPSVQTLDLIVETPGGEEDRARDIRTLKNMRTSAGTKTSSRGGAVRRTRPKNTRTTSTRTQTSTH